MKVFVTGASGFIGLGVSKAFAAAGHTVYGLVRGEDKAKLLLQNEIHPVIGDVAQPATYSKALEECTVCIHVATGTSNTPYEVDKTFIDAVRAAAAKHIYFPGAEKLLILTSGCLIYGGNPASAHRFSEDDALSHPPYLIWRRKVEQIVTQLHHQNHSIHVEDGKEGPAKLYGAVARPGFLYGLSGSYTGYWFAAGVAQRGQKGVKVTIQGSAEKRYAFIHIADLADGYLRIAETPRSVVAGQIFNFGDYTDSLQKDVLIACAKLGYADSADSSQVNVEVELQPQGVDTWGIISEQSCLVNTSKAQRLLGWKPRHISFLDNLTTYYQSWKASQK